MSTLTRDMLLGVLRHALTLAAGSLVTHGYLMQGILTPEVVAGLATGALGIGLSAYQKYQAHHGGTA